MPSSMIFLMKNLKRDLLLGDVINYLNALESQLNFTQPLWRKTLSSDIQNSWIYFMRKAFKKEKIVNGAGGEKGDMSATKKKAVSEAKNLVKETGWINLNIK
jgi:hypothetical protein